MTDETYRYALRISEDDSSIAYVSIDKANVVRKSVRTVRLSELVGRHEGPDLILDFDADNRLLGVELLG